MNSRKAFVLALLTALTGCAEKNFVPGSPLAKLNGYTRTHEQIAADDCAARHAPGSDSHSSCVTRLAGTRRLQDAAHQQNGAAIAATGAAIMATPPAPPPDPNRQICVDAFNKVYRC